MVASFTSFGNSETITGKFLRAVGSFSYPTKQAMLRVILEARRRAAFDEPGTLNNQQQREYLVREILAQYKPSVIVETGTYLGAGTKFFLLNAPHCPIFTSELNTFYANFSRERFAMYRG